MNTSKQHMNKEIKMYLIKFTNRFNMTFETLFDETPDADIIYYWVDTLNYRVSIQKIKNYSNPDCIPSMKNMGVYMVNQFV